MLCSTALEPSRKSCLWALRGSWLKQRRRSQMASQSGASWSNSCHSAFAKKEARRGQSSSNIMSPRRLVGTRHDWYTLVSRSRLGIRRHVTAAFPSFLTFSAVHSIPFTLHSVHKLCKSVAAPAASWEFIRIVAGCKKNKTKQSYIHFFFTIMWSRWSGTQLVQWWSGDPCNSFIHHQRRCYPRLHDWVVNISGKHD